ncbi:hypothetical protein BDQ17DRAFT_1329055 [Cyathus striatus]|nr:hypothetical protein BDQ17DRAFT_1329055 [Cyathus striatus]
MCLVIQIKSTEAIFCRVNVHQNRANSAAVYLGAILFTGRISMSYDEVNDGQFKVQVRIIGSQCYTLINVLPGIILQPMLIYEIFAMSSSIALSVIISFSCIILGLASLVAAGPIGEELMPVPVVTAEMTVGEN